MSQDNPMKNYWTTKQIGDKANLSAARIRQLIQKGEIPAIKLADAWFVEDSDARNWLHHYGSRNQPSRS
jgi:hypothetical protein